VGLKRSQVIHSSNESININVITSADVSGWERINQAVFSVQVLLSVYFGWKSFPLVV
jgi:hypothetical protein